MELETKIRSLLARRVERRHHEYRSATLHMKEVETHSPSLSRPCEVLADAKAITSRRGFLHEQLRMDSLTQLKRWHVQLQLIEMDDEASVYTSTPQADHGDSSSGDLQSPLERSLSSIQRDRLCFDVSFVASSTRIADRKETLFDASDKSLKRVSEALAFSSTRDGYTTRIVLFKVENSGSIRVQSSLFVPGLQTHIDKLNGDTESSGDARSIVDSLWR